MDGMDLSSLKRNYVKNTFGSGFCLRRKRSVHTLCFIVVLDSQSLHVSEYRLLGMIDEIEIFFIPLVICQATNRRKLNNSPSLKVTNLSLSFSSIIFQPENLLAQLDSTPVSILNYIIPASIYCYTRKKPISFRKLDSSWRVWFDIYS